MINDIIVVDNIFHNVDEILKNCKNQKFYDLEDHPETGPGIVWRGKRSEDLVSLDPSFFNPLFGRIIDKVIFNTYGKMGPNVQRHWTYRSFLHQLLESDIPSDKWTHRDPDCVYAGVIYLNPNPAPNTGTIIYKGDQETIVGNVYNRLVLYRADYKHRPEAGFGKDVEDSRLTMNIFIRNLMFQVTPIQT